MSVNCEQAAGVGVGGVTTPIPPPLPHPCKPNDASSAKAPAAPSLKSSLRVSFPMRFKRGMHPATRRFITQPQTTAFTVAPTRSAGLLDTIRAKFLCHKRQKRSLQSCQGAAMRKHIVWHADNVPKRTTACVDIFRPYVASG